MLEGRGTYSRVAMVAVGALVAAQVAAAAQDQSPKAPNTPRFNTEIVVTPERGETPRHLVPASTVVLDARSLPTLPRGARQ